MTIHRRVNSTLAVAGLLAVSVTLSVPGSAAAAPAAADWASYLDGPSHSSSTSTDAAVTAGNVGQLHSAWHFTPAAASKPGQPGPRLDASPTVVGGVVYIGARTGMFYALDAATGALVWKRQLGFGSNAVCPAKGITGTATVAPDPVDGVPTVYAPGAHYLYALKASDGTVRWKRSIGPATSSGSALYFNWASPTIAGGRIFIGLAANCESHLIRGGVVSMNQHTGAVQHTYYAVPSGSVGASVWSSVASDGTSVWVTTGNPDPNGTQVFDAYSIVRLSAATMKRVDKWTVPAAQAADLDLGQLAHLFPSTVAGAPALVAACNKNRVLYAWRQANLAAGPVWQRQVSVSGVDGSWRASPRLRTTRRRTCCSSPPTGRASAEIAVAGAVRALDPGTGAVVWETALPCPALGSPTVDAATQLVAVPLFGCGTGISPAVKIFDEATGTPLASLPATGSVFAQPVFAAGHVYVASESGGMTSVCPLAPKLPVP